MISSYDAIRCCYVAHVCKTSQWDSSVLMELSVSPENMEPYTRVRTSTYHPNAVCDSCQIKLENHFTSSIATEPQTITFWPCVFSEIGGLSQSPHTGGECQRDKLMSMLNEKEKIANEKANQLYTQHLELEKGLLKLHSTRQPVQKRPRSSIQRKKTQPETVPYASDQICMGG